MDRDEIKREYIELKNSVLQYRMIPEANQHLLRTWASSAGNFVIAGFKLLSGIVTGSGFLCVSGLYSALLGLSKRQIIEGEKTDKNPWLLLQNIGLYILLAGAVYGVYIGRLILYPERAKWTIPIAILIALYTFVDIGLAAYTLFGKRGQWVQKPLLLGMRWIGFVSALPMIVMTQIALNAIGNENDTSAYDGRFGAVVGLVILLIGGWVTVHAHHKQMKEEGQRMNKNRWTIRKLFVLPAIPTLLVTLMAAALLIYEFRADDFSWLRYVAYTFSAYAFILLCTSYGLLVKKNQRWAAAFTLPLIPTLIIIALGSALLVYVYAAENYGPISYVAYLLSAYALILGITSYVRLARVMGQAEPSSDEPIFLQIKAVLSAFILPYFSAIAVCTAYVFVKIFKGFTRGSILTIVSGILAMIGVIALSVVGPLFFLVGILCIHIWGRRVRGIILCALGLVLMILSNHLTIRIMEKQKDELNIQRGYPVWR